MNMAVMSINAQLAARDVKEAVGLENKIKAGMRAVIRENWMDTNDDSMMRAALAAVLTDVGKDSPEYQRVVDSMDALRKLSAFLNAARAGLRVDIADVQKALCEALYGVPKEADADEIGKYLSEVQLMGDDREVNWTYEDGWLTVIKLRRTDGVATAK